MVDLSVVFGGISIAYLAFVILAMVYVALSTTRSEIHSPLRGEDATETSD